MSTVLDHSSPVARKQHVCEECGRRIEPGEKYHRQTSVGDYGFETWRCCTQCAALASDLYDAEVRGENENGYECYAVLMDVDWPDIRLWSPLWAQRADLYAQQWDGQPYPADPATSSSVSAVPDPTDTPTTNGA